MNVLALEWSAAVGSVALWSDNHVVAQEKIALEKTAGATELLAAVECVRKAVDYNWDAIHGYAVGRGPGRYSGMRTTLTVAQHLALPGGTTVRAVSSGDALAAEVAATHSGAGHISVIGDARRDHIWQRLFTVDNGVAFGEQDWALATWADWDKRLPSGTLVVSPDWDRLQSKVTPTARKHWITHAQVPSAEWVARLAISAMEARQTPPPCSPIYLHPAVATR